MAPTNMPNNMDGLKKQPMGNFPVNVRKHGKHDVRWMEQTPHHLLTIGNYEILKTIGIYTGIRWTNHLSADAGFGLHSNFFPPRRYIRRGSVGSRY